MVYIVLVVTIMQTGSKLAQAGANANGDNFLIPIGMLSLFVLSAAIMAFIFLYQPVIMFLDGQRKESVNLFWRTVAIFGGITGIILLVAAFVIK